MTRRTILPRLQRRADLSHLDANQRRALETGDPYFPMDDRELAALWTAHRAEMLAEWITSRPGTRPFAWWKFEGVPQYGERLTTQRWTREHERHRERWTTGGILHTHCRPSLQESEPAYLFRHGLLATEEQPGAIATLQQEENR